MLWWSLLKFLINILILTYPAYLLPSLHCQPCTSNAELLTLPSPPPQYSREIDELSLLSPGAAVILYCIP